MSGRHNPSTDQHRVAPGGPNTRPPTSSPPQQVCTTNCLACKHAKHAIGQPDVGTSRSGPFLTSATRQGNGGDRFKQRFKCPFYAHDSITHQACHQKILSRLGDVRQHIMRNHLKSFCPTCGKIFDKDLDRSELDAHIKARCCKPSLFDPHKYATIDQYEMMMNTTQKPPTEKARYDAIYKIMFPYDNPPESPYYANAPSHGSRVSLRDTIRAFKQDSIFQEHISNSMPSTPTLWVSVIDRSDPSDRKDVGLVVMEMLDRFASYADDHLERHTTRN